MELVEGLYGAQRTLDMLKGEPLGAKEEIEETIFIHDVDLLRKRWEAMMVAPRTLERLSSEHALEIPRTKDRRAMKWLHRDWHRPQL
jgi:hypothetical protein